MLSLSTSSPQPAMIHPFPPKGTTTLDMFALVIALYYTASLCYRYYKLINCLDGYGQNLGHGPIPGKIVRVDEHRVRKIGRHGHREVDTMKFVAANTTIPVPKVYDIKIDGETSYILMEYMAGETLEKMWNNLTPDQRACTLSQLAGYLAQLQQLTGKRIEGINGSMVRVGSYQSRWSGPFNTEQEFNVFLAKGTDKHPSANHAIHFAHGDLSPRNILVDESGNITAVLDWEWAGWFPEYWDVTRMFLDLPSKRRVPDYESYLRSALTNTYGDEYLAMREVSYLDTPGPHLDEIVPVVSPN